MRASSVPMQDAGYKARAALESRRLAERKRRRRINTATFHQEHILSQIATPQWANVVVLLAGGSFRRR